MRASAVLREAWRNITSGTARTRGLALAAALIAALAGGSEAVFIHQLLERASEYRSSGASTLILTAEGRVDGDRCDRLAEIPGVRASGALRASKIHIIPTVLQRAPIPVSDASPGFVAVLRARPQEAGVLLGPEASTALGVHGPGSISTASDSVRVAGSYSYPDDGRRPGFSYAAIAPTNSTAPFDECWIDTWPSKDMTSALLTTIHATSDPSLQPTVTQLNGGRGRSFDGRAQFEQRITRFAGACAALGGVALGFVSVRIRRLSLASALHAGVPQPALLAIATLETVAWVTLSAALAIFTTVVGTLAASESETLIFALLAALPLWPGAFVGAWAGILTVREKHLFDYFKTR